MVIPIATRRMMLIQNVLDGKKLLEEGAYGEGTMRERFASDGVPLLEDFYGFLIKPLVALLMFLSFVII
jgi:hypothetical protein